VIDDPTRPLDAEANGHQAMPSPNPEPTPIRTGPRMPGRRTQTISMLEPYQAFRLTIWVNYPHRLANMISGGDEDQTAEALSQIVLEHNGWCDEDGEPIPQLKPAPMSARPGSEAYAIAKEAFLAFWDAIPQELALAISTAIGLEVTKLMTSVSNRRRRS
jgi:hypothetical protein